MSYQSTTTTIVLQSVHSPSENELAAILDSTIASAEHQGCAPLRAMAIFTKPVEETPDVKEHLTIDCGRVVHDGVMQAKWERKR